jgi:hypothetical protein
MDPPTARAFFERELRRDRRTSGGESQLELTRSAELLHAACAKRPPRARCERQWSEIETPTDVEVDARPPLQGRLACLGTQGAGRQSQRLSSAFPLDASH